MKKKKGYRRYFLDTIATTMNTSKIKKKQLDKTYRDQYFPKWEDR